jgi:signal transduction histidine kinase
MTAGRRTPERAGSSPWERWPWIWDGFFGLTLFVATMLAVADAAVLADAPLTIAVAGGLVVWHWQTALRRPQWEARWQSLVWFAGVLVFVWVLLGLSSQFVFLIYGLFPLLFGRLARWWSVPAVVALTALVAWRIRPPAGEDLATWLTGLGGSVLLALAVGLFVTTLVRQGAARQQALEQLEATRFELAATSRRAGALEERERLARDLHDTIAQGFTGIVMQLEASEQALDVDPGRARDHLERAKRSARDSLAELRGAVHAMRPDLLAEASLAEALERTVRRWSDETGVAAEAAADGPSRPLQPDVEVALLRTAQEGLANVARHAHAASARVRLSFDPEAVTLCVSDDGVGFVPDGSPASAGMGLQGLDERIAALGGRLTVHSRPGRGTDLVAQVPTP